MSNISSKIKPILTGAKVFGSTVSENEFVGVTTLDELRGIVANPQYIDSSNSKAALANMSEEELRVKELRDNIQRSFGNKQKNVVSYAGYIDGVRKGAVTGCVPCITLYCDNSCNLSSNDDGTAVAYIPGGSVVFAIDGDTQLSALFMIANGNGSSVKADRSIMADRIKVVVHHGISESAASQYFHDLNSFAVPVSKAIVSATNRRGPLTSLVDEIISEVTELRDGGKVSKKIDSLVSTGARARQVTTLQRLMIFSAAVANGRSVFNGTFNTSIASANSPTTAVKDARVRERVKSSVASLMSALEPAMMDRKENIDLDQPIMAALGVMFSNPRPGLEGALARLSFRTDGRLAVQINDAIKGVSAGQKKAAAIYEVLTRAIDSNARIAA